MKFLFSFFQNSYSRDRKMFPDAVGWNIHSARQGWWDKCFTGKKDSKSLFNNNMVAIGSSWANATLAFAIPHSWGVGAMTILAMLLPAEVEHRSGFKEWNCFASNCRYFLVVSWAPIRRRAITMEPSCILSASYSTYHNAVNQVSS